MVKIFSNFDTNSAEKNFLEAIEEIGDSDHVLLIRKHWLYFLAYITAPTIGGLFTLGLVIFLHFFVRSHLSGTIYAVLGWGEVLLIAIGARQLIYAGLQYYNYKLDYVIITPDMIKLYDQIGLFHRTISSSETEKIMSINLVSHGMINSLFNFGSIEILIDPGDDDGEIFISYVSNPEGLKEKILDLIELRDQ